MKILSISDIITNSSSENKSDPDYIQNEFTVITENNILEKLVTDIEFGYVLKLLDSPIYNCDDCGLEKVLREIHTDKEIVELCKHLFSKILSKAVYYLDDNYNDNYEIIKEIL